MGCLRTLSQPSSFEMSSTGIWAPSSVVWWWLKRLCNLLALSVTGVVTLVPVFLLGDCSGGVIWTPMPLCGSDFSSQCSLKTRELQKPYTRSLW